MDKFNIPNKMTVNRVTLVKLKEEDMEQLREVEKRGFIQIINYENDENNNSTSYRIRFLLVFN